jgi:hypothetical protein
LADRWIQAKVKAGRRPGMITGEFAASKRLRREN